MSSAGEEVISKLVQSAIEEAPNKNEAVCL